MTRKDLRVLKPSQKKDKSQKKILACLMQTEILACLMQTGVFIG
jgi:hypothetical protein